MNKNPYNLITIVGPTASGKTPFAARLAYELSSEIISGDSRQLYQGMDIGTGKDLVDYVVDGHAILYHLIDIVKPGYHYNVYEYQRDFLVVYQNIMNRNKLPILCGGTGMYIEAVLGGYKLLEVPPNETLRARLENLSLDELTLQLQSYKRLHNNTDVANKRRAMRAIEIAEYYLHTVPEEQGYPHLHPLIVGLSIDRTLRRSKITQRLHQRLQEGMVEEIEHLLQMGISPQELIYYGLEYKYVTQYVTGILNYQTMVNELEIAIHQFAKRQMTWFRGMERRGFTIHWLNVEDGIPSNVAKVIELIKQ